MTWDIAIGIGMLGIMLYFIYLYSSFENKEAIPFRLFFLGLSLFILIELLQMLVLSAQNISLSSNIIKILNALYIMALLGVVFNFFWIVAWFSMKTIRQIKTRKNPQLFTWDYILGGKNVRRD